MSEGKKEAPSRAPPQRRTVPIAVAGLAVLALIAIFFNGRGGSSGTHQGASGPSAEPLSARVTAAQTGSVTVELTDDPKGGFVAVFAKMPDSTLQRLKPRTTIGRSMTLDVQPGSEWLLILLGSVPQEPDGLNSQVMHAVQKDPGIEAFPMLPGVARVARLPIPP
jgi:hypothetical protein